MSYEIIKCPQCVKENDSGVRFCIYCGSSLVVDEAISGERTDDTEAKLKEAREQLLKLSERITAIEQGKSDSVVEELTDQEAPESFEQREAVLSEHGAEKCARCGSNLREGARFCTSCGSSTAQRGDGTSGEESSRVEPTRLVSERRDVSQPQWTPYIANIKKAINWERVLGMNWLAIIGSVSLVIGIGFFLGLAFQRNWIGETGRFILAISIGLALVVVGDFARNVFPKWARAAAGGGIAVLYVSAYAIMFLRESDSSQWLGFILLVLVVAMGGFLTLRYNSKVIASLSLFGAFANPLLIDSGASDTRAIMLWPYTVAVAAGILGIAAVRNWPWFTLAGLTGSYFVSAVLVYQTPTDGLVLSVVGLLLIFLVFVGATTLFHIIWKQEPGRESLAIMFANAAAFYGQAVALLWTDYQDWFGLITLALSAFYGVFGFVSLRRPGVSPRVALFSIAIGLIFLTVAIPMQFTGTWITVALAAYGTVLIWIGFVIGNSKARAFAFAVLGFAVFRLVFLDTPIDASTFQLILNDRFLTFLFAVPAFYLGAYLYTRQRENLTGWEIQSKPALLVAAHFLTVWAFSAEIVSYFDSCYAVPGSCVNYQTLFGSGTAFGSTVSITVLWATYSLIMSGAAYRTGSKTIQRASLALIVIATLKFILLDTFLFEHSLAGYTPVINASFLAFLLLSGALAGGAYLYRENPVEFVPLDMGYPEKSVIQVQVVKIVLVLANVLIVWATSTEVIRFFNGRELELGSDLASPMHFTLTLLWTGYATSVIVVGMLKNYGSVRLAGLLFLGIPIFKLYVFDIFQLEPVYRVVAFVTLGITFLMTGLAYQRYSDEIKGFIFGGTRWSLLRRKPKD
ncbi:MAG: putative membrane protein/Uncharacterized membrane protein [Chloroflexi bacterium]|jgi:uncharacterized membrane protein/DNA-directed RNA polymerase subunit M/transcription elongation factor TFIIS|nr:MAG: putative membrane protein/Uncharacterized membrane protein [Chloroflexota bacterium]